MKPNSKTDIKGGTFKEGKYGTIAYSGGTLDVSNYDAITEISIYNQNESLVAPLDSIVLPNNYCFYDEENAAVTQLLKLKKSYIGVAPSTNMHTITYEANGGVGEGFSYQAYGKHYLSECTFEAPSGMVFKGWLVEGKEYQEGNPITVYTNTTIKAVWTKYVPQIVINMRDSYGDGWDGNKIIVKKDDENIAEAKVSGKSASLTIDYDQTSEYTFYWQSGSYSDECSFEILLENELMLKHNDCDDYDNGQLILTIKAKPLDSYAIDEKDLTDYSQTKDIDVVSLSYTRNFTNTSWQSLYIPFEIPVTEELLTDFEIADLNDIRQYDRDEDGVKDETVVEAFKVKSGTTLASNYPYLIRAKEAGEKTITVIDATLYAAEEVSIDCSSIREKFTFTGTYSRMESNVLIGCYALSKGEWQPLAADATLGAFRVYLKIESRNSNTVSARAIRIHVVGEDDTTDINELESSADDQQPTVVYDLQGRRIMNADNLKGVYIINGKKVVK